MTALPPDHQVRVEPVGVDCEVICDTCGWFRLYRRRGVAVKAGQRHVVDWRNVDRIDAWIESKRSGDGDGAP